MRPIKQLLDSKASHKIYSVAPHTSVLDALRLLAEADVGAVLVMDGERMAGIFSERDYARRVVLQGKSSRETPVREVMTDRIVCVQPSQTVEEAMAMMTEVRCRHLPVVEHGRVIGVVSIGDLVKEIISEQEFLIQQLETYITQ
ncbi:MAG TPA: CBS domain-containing protein [Burkholderiales bacterium]|nr:CBS domain-containing protein [Betaproteobacteria bacterium]HQR52766.1 CBS domain-containing protein [Burkholderiales bacterium]